MSLSQLQTHFFEIELKDEQVTKEQLMELFFDIDFIGSESERVATEFLEKDIPAFDMIEGCIEAQCESSGFYLDYNISATRIEDTYVIAVATMVES